MKKKEDRSSPQKWVACPVEEDYFGSDRKLNRLERKKKSSKDRSKFKKTDKKKYTENLQNEIQERVIDKELFLGRVLSITSQGALVDYEGETYTCMVRGLLKREQTQFKRLVTVGDIVLFAKMPDREGMIVKVEPRRSVLSRADNLSRKKEHLIAANIDQVLITSSVVDPPLKPSLIDRYIIASLKGSMNPVVIVNKIDLLDDENYDEETRTRQRMLIEECEMAYARIGIPFLKLSVKNCVGVHSLRDLMKNRTSVFSGQSGTGKSSLINVTAGLNLPVGDTVRQTRKGTHTTTQSKLVRLDCGGYCIDTPGIKSFGMWDLAQEEVQRYFSEIQESSVNCHFPNCSHTHEENCQVINDVESGRISPLRYESYLSLIESASKRHLRR